MHPILILALSVGAAVAGVFSARSAGPARLGWREHPLALRLAVMKQAAPSRLRCVMGAALVSIALASGGLVAQAAQPAAPDSFAREVMGVVGSGDRLSLRLEVIGGTRTVGVGDEYKDGWKLESLTPSEAILRKEGETRRIGLNPSGAVVVTAPQGPPAEVARIGMLDGAAITRWSQAYLDRMFRDIPEATVAPLTDIGLTVEELRRYRAYRAMLEASAEDPAMVGLGSQQRARLVWGEAGQEEYDALRAKSDAVRNDIMAKAAAAGQLAGPAVTEATWANGVISRSGKVCPLVRPGQGEC